MEYLMTYGWSILIVSIVLASLWSMGVFSSNSTLGRAPPASCRVFRPGPGTSNAYITLLGACTSQAPQYVAQFNGAGSNVNIGTINQEAGTNSISFAGWFYTSSFASSYPTVFGDTIASPRSGYDLYVGGPGSGSTGYVGAERFFGCSSCATGILTANPISMNTWYFATVTYDGSAFRFYLNGVLVGSTANTNSITPDSIMTIGAASGTGYFWGGDITNFQIYNTSLSSNQVASLYAEGVGGVPTALSNLVGWWPLNGDSKDYSGNNNNGAPTSVVYSSSWTK
jgi:hypothetical protein